MRDHFEGHTEGGQMNHSTLLYFRGAMTLKWIRAPRLLRRKTMEERGYEVRSLTDRQARKLNEAMK